MPLSARVPGIFAKSGLGSGLCLAVLAVPLLVDIRVATAAGPAPFLAHQAAYDLSLKTSRRSPSIEAAEGRIVYNFSGSECEGYTTDFRQVSRLNTGEGRTVVSDLRSSSWEEGKGSSFRFRIETRMNNENSSSVDGAAERTANGIVIKLKQPQTKTFTIDKATVFPTEQVHRILDAARAGKSILELSVYDGSDNGEKIYNTLTVIGQPIPGERAPSHPDVGSGNEALKSLARWPVTVSYYDRAAKSGTGEQTPVYAMSFELYENGVSRALTLDYNDFVITGAMSKFDVKTTKPCK
ncbi:cell envelope integrity EipB family protein [Bradyrhizobium sp. LHD-71]|uniref:cell envelope integrity EipB family protein n=1 Tax=Bradyrhizobium sp. LHD-71 TaxID=3072141 RepID=UPI00280CAB85|nr:cell envelope integrity EipB family protein [Bradyrhizobium sp. LHD-71]MDQ8726268.1 cell envelope integrity EipB family protein [Bradyrhizobium sp. LHD-71]